MKLLASDYDGTFNSDLKNLYINIREVKKFREKGNKFAIVTGRSYSSMKKEIERHNIEYDYLSCNNGLIIFDKEDNIIKSNELKSNDLIILYNLLLFNNCLKYFKLYNFYESTQTLYNILEIYAKFKSSKKAQEFKDYIENSISNLKCYFESKKLFIGYDFDKADAVSFIQKLENIEKENIITIGDYKNDLSMLKQFNGYKMLYSYPCLWGEKIPTTREVHTLIKKINK